MSQKEYIQWPTNADVPFMVTIVDGNGEGITGLTPKVSIQRYKDVAGTALLDGYYWDPAGPGFVSSPTWIDIPPYDAVNHPGVYVFVWDQTTVGIEQVYAVGFKHEVAPKGRAMELHIVTNEVYIPATQPDPIIFGPSSVMGQLELIKDGGTGDFDPAFHSLAKLGVGVERVLGLLHQNAIVDNQVYDTNGQLTSARIRVFDDAADVPANPGGSETTGLLQEYSVTASYAGLGALINYQLKKVL